MEFMDTMDTCCIVNLEKFGGGRKEERKERKVFKQVSMVSKVQIVRFRIRPRDHRAGEERTVPVIGSVAINVAHKKEGG